MCRVWVVCNDIFAHARGVVCSYAQVCPSSGMHRFAYYGRGPLLSTSFDFQLCLSCYTHSLFSVSQLFPASTIVAFYGVDPPWITEIPGPPTSAHLSAQSQAPRLRLTIAIRYHGLDLGRSTQANTTQRLVSIEQSTSKATKSQCHGTIHHNCQC